jgi:hypothetical protein
MEQDLGTGKRNGTCISPHLSTKCGPFSFSFYEPYFALLLVCVVCSDVESAERVAALENPGVFDKCQPGGIVLLPMPLS